LTESGACPKVCAPFAWTIWALKKSLLICSPRWYLHADVCWYLVVLSATIGEVSPDRTGDRCRLVPCAPKERTSAWLLVRVEYKEPNPTAQGRTFVEIASSVTSRTSAKRLPPRFGFYAEPGWTFCKSARATPMISSSKILEGGFAELVSRVSAARTSSSCPILYFGQLDRRDLLATSISTRARVSPPAKTLPAMSHGLVFSARGSTS